MLGMKQKQNIRGLINRLARLDAGQGWSGDLNPAQRSALEYLGHANRFSRAPSHVADFLGATRGTTSQTLKALVRKGYVSEERSATDKRSISYSRTAAGQEAAITAGLMVQSIAALPDAEIQQLEQILLKLLRQAVAANGHRHFGICHTCRYFKPRAEGGFCTLLNTALEPFETQQICHEQDPA
jgi:DNA-binding MarR family transcriptional regulator